MTRTETRVVAMAPVLLLSLIALSLSIISPNVVDAQGAIATAYLNSNASRFAPNYNTIISVAYYSPFDEFQTNVLFYPSVNISTQPLTGPASVRYVPNMITMPYPYCATNVSIVGGTCPGGTLYYGYMQIPRTGSGVPANEGNAYILNGETSSSIVGMNIPSLDAGGSSPSRGTLTYLPPPNCIIQDNSWNLRIGFRGMFDVPGNGYPISYEDSASGRTGYMVSYGLDCVTTPRSPNASPILSGAILLPVCRGILPRSSATDIALYEQIYGVGTVGPSNSEEDLNVYMLRVDNLLPNIYVIAKLAINYVDDTFEFKTIQASFDRVMYIQTTKRLPAIIYGCFGHVNCDPFSNLLYNENELYYTQQCACGRTVYCPSPNNTMILLDTNFDRSLLPYFQNPSGFTLTPTCAFIINPEMNQSMPIPGIPFSLSSVSSGGVLPLAHSWIFFDSPVATLIPPTTGLSVAAIVTFPGFYNVRLAVTGANGYTTTCTRTFEVFYTLPYVCYTPTSLGNSFTLLLGQSVTFDASCSISSTGTPLTYGWRAYTVNNISASEFPFTMSTTTGTSNQVSAAFPGQAMIFLNVTNELGSSTTTIYITISPMTATPSTPLPPFLLPIAPTPFINPPTEPFSLPISPPYSFPPLGTMPAGPQAPMDLNPFGSSPGSGTLPPNLIPPVNLMFTIIIIIIIIIVAIVLFIVLRQKVKIAKRRAQYERLANSVNDNPAKLL